MNWTIQDLGSAGELIAAVATVLTLAYLATQIRQSTTQTRNQGHTDVTDSYNNLVSQLLADNDLFKIIIKGCQEWTSIEQFEQSRFHLFFHQNLNHWRMAYQLHQKGAIDDDVYKSIEDLHARVLDNPGARQWWNLAGRSLFEHHFVDSVDCKLKSVEGLGSSTTEAWSFYHPEEQADSR